MPLVIIRLENTRPTPQDSPLACPKCQSGQISHWGQESKNVYDTKPISTIVHRFRCKECSHTFRYYPKGIDRSQYSIRIRKMAALIWLMDLSIRDVVDVFEELGITLNRMTVWREGQKLVDQLNAVSGLNPGRRYILNKDIRLEDHPQGGVVLALSLEPGNSEVLGTLDTKDPRDVIAWLSPILKGLDIHVSLIATKDNLL